MRGVFLDDHSVSRGDLDLEALRSTLPEWAFRGTTATSEVAAAIRDADIVISNKVLLDSQALTAATRLKLVCIAATGTNNVDLVTADRLGITVCNVQAYATTSVVEHVFMVMLALSHRLQNHTRAVHQGDWQTASNFSLLDHPFNELNGKTLGIIGYGELGKAVARTAEAFGLRILVSQRPGGPDKPGRCTLEQLLQKADIISLHCPLTDATRNLIGRAELAKMRNSALLINTARGGIVNEADLADALRAGDIAGAALDVLTEEPPRHGNPLLDPAIPNLIVTPHVAWAGINSRQTLVNELTANIQAFLAGTPRNVVHA
ncbi:MAG: 2-hydroxyacid dehydrogenase [Gammaproteobacteria bacterium]|nr:2-hydroxyacid dehydrogenase [Gammaproteobacteria bacterium]